MPILSEEIEIEETMIVIEEEKKEHIFEAEALMVEGRKLVPIRLLLETLGAEVSWDKKSNTVICYIEDTEIKIPVGSNVAIINGIPRLIDVSAYIIDGKTYVPIRFVGETLGYLVEYDCNTETISICKIDEDLDSFFTSEEPQITKTFQGTASWYGDKLHGRNTASGEVFNENAYTAAHRSLPFGTYVNVTFLKTGRSVIVKINDRGPHSNDRIIDLSKAAAEEIGLRSHGLGEVKLEVIEFQD